MTLADPSLTMPRATAPTEAKPLVGTRDPRLDFFRGIAMFIILIAHVPGNWLTLWIPARFGFSDATETFVFCSGMASAIAFGRAFRDQGLAMGTTRVSFRIWQVYWAHIGLFFAIACAMVSLNALFPDGRDYVGQLNLYPFFKDPQTNLLGLMTLTYVPNYFDILPMYLVILAMMPLMIALARIHLGLAALASITLWLSANILGWNFPAEPWSERGWFFNPLGWQLIFFTGFAFMSGWIPAPPVDRRLFWGAVTIIVITLPFAYFRLYNTFPVFLEWRRDWSFLFQKTDFGILRYVHFLATAYVAWVLAGPKGANIRPSGRTEVLARIWQKLLAVIMKVGQQSLAVFIGSMFLARLMGALLDQVGRTALSMLWVNALGFALIVAVAYGAGWFKSQPWKKKA
ncbi:OpgC domain-containing protein [Marivita sp. S6314]|uniref:OpgC family protein n=1 Tax=Marivita sp. S6314 TaxID=2926406 RepID=UPI001FF48871|nr:OpgC domain-containing protein [Marivita sp. S6314]MCK0150351.1 OpgC domain-containing protein [Marivita sp. S6314]